MSAAELETRLAEARATAATLDSARQELEAVLLKIGRITGPNGLAACTAGILLRVQRQLAGPL